MKFRNGFVSNSSSSSFILKFAKPFLTYAQKYKNVLKDRINDAQVELKYCTSDAEKQALQVSIKRLEDDIAEGYVQIIVDWNAIEDSRELLNIMKDCGVIEEWEERDL